MEKAESAWGLDALNTLITQLMNNQNPTEQISLVAILVAITIYVVQSIQQYFRRVESYAIDINRLCMEMKTEHDIDADSVKPFSDEYLIRAHEVMLKVRSVLFLRNQKASRLVRNYNDIELLSNRLKNGISSEEAPIGAAIRNLKAASKSDCEELARLARRRTLWVSTKHLVLFPIVFIQILINLRLNQSAKKELERTIISG